MTTLNNLEYLKVTRRKLRNESTPAEKHIWKYLKGSQLLGLKFRRQHSIDRYILDFYCPKLKIGIEIDGSVHYNQKEYDKLRTQELSGYIEGMYRYTNEEVLNKIDWVIQDLEQKITPLLRKEGLGVV